MMKFKRILTILSAALLCLGLFSCRSSSAADKSPDRLTVVATNFAMYDFARAVCGDVCDVYMLLSPGTDAHDFEATLEDIALIEKADVFVYVGGESEDWVDSVLSAAGASDIAAVCAIDAVETYEEELVEGMESEEEANEDEAEIDEHVWTSPRNAVTITTAVRDTIIAAAPDFADTFTANAADYIAKLEQIDAELRNIVETAARKTIVVADRFPFRYLAEEYGLTYYAAFTGCSSATEPALATVDFLINRVTSENIPYVFIIEFSDGKTAEAISRETGCGILTLHSAHNVTKSDFDAGITYVQIMQSNAESLKAALN